MNNPLLNVGIKYDSTQNVLGVQDNLPLEFIQTDGYQFDEFSGGSKGGARDARPPSGLKFLHFHAVFGKN